MVLVQIITGFMGIFGVAVFAVPVGLLGAGFEEWVESVQSKKVRAHEINEGSLRLSLSVRCVNTEGHG